MLNGINDAFSGSAPDLGAYEFGKPLPRFGPRPEAGNGVVVGPNSAKMSAAMVISSLGDHRVVFRVYAGKGPLVLSIYTIAGRRIAEIHDDGESSSARILAWRHVPGVYFARMAQARSSSTQQFLVR
jgi:hypothetical protein